MNPQVTDYMDKVAPDWQAEICKHLRQVILESIPEAEERLQYGKPHYLKHKKYACVLGTAKAWVSLTIFNAQALETPDGLFESSENGDRKTIKIKQGQTVDYALLGKLISQAASSL